jgi:hypothetical protein
MAELLGQDRLYSYSRCVDCEVVYRIFMNPNTGKMEEIEYPEDKIYNSCLSEIKKEIGI